MLYSHWDKGLIKRCSKCNIVIWAPGENCVPVQSTTVMIPTADCFWRCGTPPTNLISLRFGLNWAKRVERSLLTTGHFISGQYVDCYMALLSKTWSPFVSVIILLFSIIGWLSVIVSHRFVPQTFNVNNTKPEVEKKWQVYYIRLEK